MAKAAKMKKKKIQAKISFRVEFEWNQLFTTDRKHFYQKINGNLGKGDDAVLNTEKSKEFWGDI